MAESGDDLLAGLVDRLDKLNRQQGDLIAAARRKGDAYVDPQGLLRYHTTAIGELIQIVGLLVGEIDRLRHQD